MLSKSDVSVIDERSYSLFLSNNSNYSSILNDMVGCRCCCGRLVRQHACFTASLAMKYSDVKLAENYNQEVEEWSVEKHTEQTSTDAYGVINFQGGSHSYRAKACMTFAFFLL